MWQSHLGNFRRCWFCDAYVHVGGAIPGCGDKQDWDGVELLKLVDNEGLYLLNREELCTGLVTRIDPRNGTRSTLGNMQRVFVERGIRDVDR